jgi:hypothetical protein
MNKEFSHYYKNVKNLEYIDVYRVLELFNVTDPCIQHAVKKLLVAGGRGHKGMEKDIREAIVSLNRKLEMWDEENVNVVVIDDSEKSCDKYRRKESIPAFGCVDDVTQIRI